MAGIARAQSSGQPAASGPAPSRLDRVKSKVKQSIEELKLRSKARQTKSKECRDQARARRLQGKKTREFLDQCLKG
jgi:hypothetical protein